MYKTASKCSIIIVIITLANNPRMGEAERVDAIVWSTSWSENMLRSQMQWVQFWGVVSYLTEANMALTERWMTLHWQLAQVGDEELG